MNRSKHVRARDIRHTRSALRLLASEAVLPRLARKRDGQPRVDALFFDWNLPLATAAKAVLWLGIFAATLNLCPEAFAVALEPPLLKCFPPDRQAVILGHLAAVAFASLMLLT